MEILDLADYALTQFSDSLTLGEFKYLDVTREIVNTRNDNVNGLINRRNRGLGIRVLIDGSWGYAASDKLTKESVDLTIKRAEKLANASNKRSPNIQLTEEPVFETKVSTEFKIDPFLVPLEEKISYLLDTAEVATKYPEVKYANGYLAAQKDNFVLYSTEGNKIQQQIVWTGALMTMILSGNGDTQVRKYPDDSYGTKGWEFIQGLDIEERIDEIAKETVKLLQAPTMKPGKSTIILNPSQLGLQLHESCGHPSELDRSLGYEAAYAGTSFLKTELLDQNFMYGNELVSINADATIDGGLGSFPFDHEGVKGKNTPLVKNGKFVGFLSSRETASIVGLDHSGGAMRSEVFDKIPLVRMTNIVLQPGEWDFDEIISDTKDGYYLHTNRSWSIDDLRYNFQFACEIGYRIENGEITGLIKNPTYTGITDEFWNSVSAVGKEKHLEVLGTPTCGKGEPGQTMYTGHGGPPTRFENVRIGVID